MPAVLGKVTTRAIDVPRGPDVVHRVRVARDWFAAGRALELELPRNLTCAACEGGGCDLCERSGAFTLRGRGEPAELLHVTLPEADPDAPPDSPHSVTIRIPEQGGLPAPGADLPRGVLLLRVVAAEESDASVRLVPLEVPVVVPPERRAATIRPLLASERRVWLWLVIAAGVVLGLLALKRLLLG
ncbi:MAG TPA: hypothetical protein VGM29_04610 [Polyangiaceae bacterium]